MSTSYGHEFSQKNYEGARTEAENVKIQADAIMGIFENIDRNMRALYGDAWQSSGADASNGRYQELKTKYDEFYTKIINMQQYIKAATANYEKADAEVSQNITEN